MDRDQAGKIIHAARYAVKHEASAWESLTEGEKEEWRITAEISYREMLKALEDVGGVFRFVDGEPERIMTSMALENVEDWLGRHSSAWQYPRPTLEGKITRTISHLEEQAESSLRKLKSFQDDILTYLRAVALVADTVGKADTHKEKNARLRGLIAQIESAIQRIRDGQENLLTNYWYQKPDLFRSDYPILRYLEEIDRLKSQIESLKQGRESDDAHF